MEITSHHCHVRKRKAVTLEPLPFSTHADDRCALGVRRIAKPSRGHTVDIRSVPRGKGDEGPAYVMRAGNTPERLHPPHSFSDTLPTPHTKARSSSHMLSLMKSFCPALMSTPQSKGTSPYTGTPSHVISPPTPSPLSPAHTHLDITVLASETPPIQTPHRIHDSRDGIDCISETPHPR